MMSRARAVLVTALLLSGACGRCHDEAGTAPGTAGSTATTAPAGSQLGVPHLLHTHCGVQSTTVDGQLWLADPPISDGSDNPLPGWGPNDTDGTFVRLTGTEAEFRASTGPVARFRRAPAGTADPGAGCE